MPPLKALPRHYLAPPQLLQVLAGLEQAEDCLAPNRHSNPVRMFTGQMRAFVRLKKGAGFAGQQPAVPQNKNQQVMASVYSINVFNDERDDILKKWNMLQACWGKGKGFYSTSQPAVEYTPQNPFYRLVWCLRNVFGLLFQFSLDLKRWDTTQSLNRITLRVW